MRILPLCLALLLAATGPCLAGETLSRVKSQGTVRCGVSQGVPGFSAMDASGRWTGLDADFCRAVAAAALGDPDKVAYKPLAQLARFPSLMAKEIDLLAQNATYTLAREASFKVSFVGPLLLAGLRFMVRPDDPARALADLDGATVCVSKGTTHEQNLADLEKSGLTRCIVLPMDGISRMMEGFYQGRCRAVAGDGPVLSSLGAKAPDGSPGGVLLPGIYSKEPLSPVVLGNDPDWLLLNKAVLSVVIEAEECGLTREAALSPQALAANAPARIFLAETEVLTKPLGLAPGWALKVVQAVGNYGEIFERNLGAQSPLNYPRGVNKLWKDGGLIYALPFN